MNKVDLMNKFGISISTLRRIGKKIGKNISEDWTDDDVESLKGILEQNSKKAYNRGKRLSDEQKQVLSEKLKGRTVNGETKKRISDALKGRSFTSEHRLHLSESQKGKVRGPASEEAKRNMSIAQRGHATSEETKRKIATTLTGRHLSEETKEKLRKANTGKKYSTKDLILKEYPNFDGVLLGDVSEEKGLTTGSILQTFNGLVKYVTYKNRKYAYVSKEDLELVKKGNPGTSKQEKEIADFLEQYVEIERNDRDEISPKELDIYIPSKKVAVEFNGLYWHSELSGKDKNYHYEKYQDCKKNGIRCIQIFGDEWQNKKDILKSILLSAIGVYKEKYYARKCVVKQIPTKVANEFLDLHHINGSVCTASKAWGLLYKGELLQVISVGRNRFKKDGKTMELLRMATKGFTQVVGGFSKILKDSGIEELESYVDRRMYNGRGYESSGWKVVGESRPSYFYTDFKVRKNRMAFMKSKLPPVEGIEGGGTEIERAHAIGWYRIWDCGTIKVSWKRK